MGEGIDRLMTAIQEAYAVWNRRVPTAALNRWFDRRSTPTRRRGFGPAPEAELHHAGQGASAELHLFCSRADAVPKSYLRYLVNTLREFFELPGTPVRISLRGRKIRSLISASAFMSEQAANGVVETPPARGAPVIFIFVTICSIRWRSASSFRSCRS